MKHLALCCFLPFYAGLTLTLTMATARMVMAMAPMVMGTSPTTR